MAGNESGQSEISRLGQEQEDLKWQIERTKSIYKPTTGAGAPTSTPTFIGQTYVDTTTGNVYIAVGTSGSWNWAFVGAGALSNDYLVGLTSWYDASDSLTPAINGATLTGWNDKGSNLNHCTTVIGTPQYMTGIQNSLPAAYFNGSEMIYGANQADVAQPHTQYLVFKPTGWSTGIMQKVINMYNSSPQINKTASATTIEIYAGATVVGESLSNNVTTMVTAIFNGASSSIQVNGNTPNTGNAGTNTNSNSPQIGASDNVPNYPYTGYIMEWRVYTGVHTSAQQAVIRNYLNTKWAVY